jgi:DASH complex subunit DAM1
MEALRSKNEVKARDIHIANSADKTTVTDADLTFAGNTTTGTGILNPKSGIPAKKKGAKAKLSAKEKKERSVSGFSGLT